MGDFIKNGVLSVLADLRIGRQFFSFHTADYQTYLIFPDIWYLFKNLADGQSKNVLYFPMS